MIAIAWLAFSAVLGIVPLLAIAGLFANGLLFTVDRPVHELDPAGDFGNFLVQRSGLRAALQRRESGEIWVATAEGSAGGRGHGEG